MGYSELMEWDEYLSLYPLHEDRAEYQTAVLSKISASSVSKEKLDYRDFMITVKKPKAEPISGKALNDYILKAMA